MVTVGDKQNPVHFDRHAPDYIDHFTEITHELHGTCPLAWTETYGGHWVASGYKEVFELARHGTLLSKITTPRGERNRDTAGSPSPTLPTSGRRPGSWRWTLPNSGTGAGRSTRTCLPPPWRRGSPWWRT